MQTLEYYQRCAETLKRDYLHLNHFDPMPDKKPGGSAFWR
jgi:hypothetical protein